MINLKGFLVLLLVILISEKSNGCKLTPDIVKEGINSFLKDTQLCKNIREQFGNDGLEVSLNLTNWLRRVGLLSTVQLSSTDKPSISELCWIYTVSFVIFDIELRACVSRDRSVQIECSSLSAQDNNCKNKYLENIIATINNYRLCMNNWSKEEETSTSPEPTRPSSCTCPDYTSLPTTRTTGVTTSTAMSSTMTPDRSDLASAFTSGPSTVASSGSSDSSSLTSTITTSSTSASTPKPSSATSQSTTVSTISSSLTSDKSPPITERQHDAPDVGQGHSEATTAIIAVTSFIVGVLVGILCLLALYYKRTGKLCFTSTKKPTEGLSSDRVTKKVLAKHLRSVRHDSPASNNVVHYESEPNTKGVDDDTEGMYTYIDQSDAGKDQKPSGDKGRLAPIVPKQPGTKMKTQQEYTDITFSNPAAVTPPDEHVYNHLELERQVDQTEQPRKAINGVANGDQSYGAVKGLRVPETTNSDVFDCGRDSSVSGHDYFVLQNENFRTSQQPEVLKEPEVKVSDGASATRSDEMASTGDAENSYFVLKKE